MMVNRWSFEQLPVSRGSSVSRAGATKRARCSPTSMAGLPKASTPPPSKMPRRCSRSAKPSMRCSKCETEGIPGKKFCGECGSPLSNRCSNCDSDNAPGAKFCADCGSALNGDVAGQGGGKGSAVEAVGGVRVAPERPAGDPLDGERKTVTALFADIKG